MASKMTQKLDGVPVQILGMESGQGLGQKSAFDLKVKALKDLLEPINNTEVAVIAIVGPSGKGKSFLLNYMCRFLADYKNINGWMGNEYEPLQGFNWRRGDNRPIGLWLSKPFIIKKSNGKEIAVILMDTQGLSDQTECSKILGISLMVSSCLIVNVFSDISEDILISFDSYLKYCFNSYTEESIPFQTLLFLIRDWNTPNQYKFGLTGGQQYLENKLIVRDNQSEVAQNVRKNIQKCFKEFHCFLMPPFGDVIEKRDFNGSLGQLRDRFKEKLKEFISTLLNPEELVPKMIDGIPITGEELYQHFQEFVKIFNREELPESHQILEAKNRLSDNIVIRKLRDLHLTQLRAFIQTKPFITRNDLRERNEVYKTENIEKVEALFESNNTKLVDKLYYILRNNYEIVCKENEVKRRQYIEEKRDLCGQEFMDALNKELQNNGFVESQTLEELFKTNEKKTFVSFKQYFGGEDNKLFDKDLYELSMFINNFEKATRAENYRRIRDFDQSKEEFSQKVVDHYNEWMERLLEDEIYLTKEQFKEVEPPIRIEIIDKFRNDCNFGNSSTNEMFFLKVKQKLKESKALFKAKNQNNYEIIVNKTESVITDSIEVYKNEMNERLELIGSEEHLEKSHKIILNKVLNEMQNKLPFKATDFLNSFIEIFNSQTNKLYDEFRNQFKERQDSCNQKYEKALKDAKDHYIKGMTESIEAEGFLSSEELNKIHKTYQESSLSIYERDLEDKNGFEFKLFKSELKEFISEEFDRFVELNQQKRKSDETMAEVMFIQTTNTFNRRMNQMIELVVSEEQLSNGVIALKEELKKEISNNYTVSNKRLFEQSLLKLENNFDESFVEFNTKFEEKRRLIVKDYENKFIQSKDLYKQKMNQLLENNEYVTDLELEEFDQGIQNLVISDLTEQLEPLIDLRVNPFIEEVKQFVCDEYQRYLVVNEAKRNNTSQLIESLSKDFIEEYELKMNKDFDSIQSVNKLQAKHTEILNEIIEKSRNTTELSKDRLKSLQTIYIETEITKLFTNILTKFEDRINDSKKTYNSVFAKTTDLYKTTMESYLKNSEMCPTEEFNKFLVSLRADTIEYFEDLLKENQLIFDDFNDRYLNILYDFMSISRRVYIQRNEENIALFDDKLKQKAKSIERKYSQLMNESIDPMLTEADLNSKHYEVMQNLLSEFNAGIQLEDITLLEPYQQSLQSFMKNELSVLQNNLNKKFKDIISGYEKTQSNLIAHYVKEIESIINREEIFTEEEFKELQIGFHLEVISDFENHLQLNPCYESQQYLDELKADINEKAIQFEEMFKTSLNSKLERLENAVQRCADQYQSLMNDNITQHYIKTTEDLESFDTKIKEKLIKNFKEKYRFHSESKITPFVETIDESFKTHLIEFELILEINNDIQEKLNKNLSIDVRLFYEKEMQKFFQNKLYVPKNVFNKCHLLVLRNTIEKYSPEKGNLSDDKFKELVEESIAVIFNKMEEENEMKRQTDSPAIGIDLGTTNSCVAYLDPLTKNMNNVIVIPNEFNLPTTPSVVSFRNKEDDCVGEVAKDEIHSYPRNTISSVKRLIGRKYNDESVQNDMNLWPYNVVEDIDTNNPRIHVKLDEEELVLYPEQISAAILIKMKKIAESHLGCKVTKAVITVPAYFNDGQKQATKDAGRMAGLEVLRIINEPTAAAIAFKVDRNIEIDVRQVLIFDFGGGTFDVSILEINRGKIIVRAVGGDNHLGGDDFDTNIVKYCLEEFYKECNIRVEGEEGVMAMCRLRNKCEEHKRRLTAVKSTIISIDSFYKRNDLRVVLTRDKFEELNHHLFVRSIDLVKKTLKEKNIRITDIDDVVLVGGSTRIPKILQMLSKFFKGKPLNHWVNPDEAVAKGAAIQAAYLNSKGSSFMDWELLDVTPLSLGIRIREGKMSVIIPRNSPVPTSVTKDYYTSEDEQTVVGIRIFEGEDELADNNHLLGHFNLSGIPSGRRGEQRLDVTFSLNDEGILHVIAKIASTGGEEDIEIIEHKGRLTKEKIEQLIAQEHFRKIN